MPSETQISSNGQGRISRRALLLSASACLIIGDLALPSLAWSGPLASTPTKTPGAFPLIQAGTPAPIYVDADANPAVHHVANAFATDLGRVSGKASRRLTAINGALPAVIIIGISGACPMIDMLIKSRKIDVHDIENQWEAYRQIIVDNPFPGVGQALVIVGTDRRGAVFGTYDLSERIGVSPWHWFADVPVRRQANVYLSAGSRRDQPKVKYRGFFINDEDPGLNSWARTKFGGINSAMYAHVFELLLRLKGNYLWPAMWAPKAFNDDDPQNMILADAMGVVMGTSHHEPLTRAQDEWHRHTDKGVTGGKWDYATNGENLRKFWRGGIERMMSKGDGKGYEALVTVGMRGDGDEAMSEGTATALLEKIVADQRAIIADVTRRPAEETPQIWALYKEVQDYYDHGMKVPDDVTLLFSDDNWGQIRRLPAPGSARKGGYGVYYHFDYVGGPRNYKWLNTNQIEKTWQQMDLAWASGARTVWIVNVGDIKPVEFPLSFFMKQAWDPEAMTPAALASYPQDWARMTFGPAQAKEIGALVTRYSQLAARRKPELIDAESFALGAGTGPLLDGGEFGAMVAEWQSLESRMRAVRASLSKDALDAFGQLVDYPITAMSNLYQLYYAVAWNRRLATANDQRANHFADRAEAAFKRDAALTDAYHALAGGKWKGMMSQTHIGYTSWQQPDKQIMPKVDRLPSKGPVPPIRFALPTPPPEHVIAIEAPRYSRAVNAKGLRWQVISHLGRISGAVIAMPQGQPATSPADGMRLDYDVMFDQSGPLTVDLHLAPTLDPSGQASLRIGLSVDEGDVTILTDHLIPAPNDAKVQAQRDWEQAMKDNVRILRAQLPSVAAGKHVIKIWRIDDNVVVQKLVASTGAIPPSYLGPPARS